MTTKNKKKIIDDMNHYYFYKEIMGKEFQINKAIRSPFRKDNRASFSIYVGYDNKLKWHDFAYGGGDIYKLVMDVKGVSFKEAVDILYLMANHKDHDLDFNSKINVFNNKMENIDILNKVLKPHNGNWSKKINQILDYLDSIYIKPKYLHEYNGFFCDGYYVLNTKDQTLSFPFSPKSGWGIFFTRRNSDYTKFWFPQEEKKFRYKASKSDGSFFGKDRIEILFNLKNDRKIDIIICAGEKDCLTLASHQGDNLFDDYPRFLIPVALSSESANLTWEQYDFMKKHSENIFIYYDNDKTGKENMEKICKEYPDIITINDLHEQYPNLNDYNDIVTSLNGKHPNWVEILTKNLNNAKNIIS